MAADEPSVLDDEYWIVLFVVDAGPARYYLYDRDRRAARFLFTNRAALEGQPLVKMHPVVIKSRDGLDLVAYYSLPAGSDADGDRHPGPAAAAGPDAARRPLGPRFLGL